MSAFHYERLEVDIYAPTEEVTPELDHAITEAFNEAAELLKKLLHPLGLEVRTDF